MIGVINQPLRLLCIFVFLYGVHTISVVIEGSKGGLLGKNGTEIECVFPQLDISHVSFMAFNESSITSDLIAIYRLNRTPTLNPQGQYLKGRVTLTPITQSSRKAVMTFNKLMCIDDKSYQCNVNYYDSGNVPHDIISNNILSITVQVPPSKPESISLDLTPADSSVTTTNHMDPRTSLPSTGVTLNTNNTVSASTIENQITTTAFNHSTIQTSGHNITTSTPSTNTVPSDTTYETTTSSTQQIIKEKVIAEGDNVTVVCTGEVGNPPAEHFFQKYSIGYILSMTYIPTETSISEISENCSYYRTSNLTFQVTAEDNNAVIRCVVNSSMASTDIYIETKRIEVYSDKTTPSTSGSGLNKAKDNGTVIVVVVVVLIVIGVVVVLQHRRIRTKEEYKPVDRMESNADQIESQEATQTVPSTSSTLKTTGYEDVDLDDPDVKFKLLCNVETIAQVKQHNEEYWKKLKEDEEREKDNPTQPPQAAVYACVNKPKSTVTTENKPPAGQEEEDVYEDSKEGLYDTSGDRRHKENSTLENYDSTEKFKNEESDDNDLFSEQNSKIGANINKSYGNSEHKEEKRQVATVSPTVRMSSSSQGDGQKRKSDEIQPKTEKLTTQETFL